MNPRARDYMHYSNPHQSFSRIDHFFILQQYVPLVHRSDISDSAWSDHSLLLLTLNGGPIQRPGFHWRFNASILSNSTHISKIEKHIQEYFLLNDTDDISPSTLWAAHKAAIRGSIIQISSRIRKARKMDIDRLEREFSSLSKLHKSQPSYSTTKRLESARTALNLALTAIAEKSLQWEGGRFYHQK